MEMQSSTVGLPKTTVGTLRFAQSVIKVTIMITLDIPQYLALEICALLEIHAA